MPRCVTSLKAIAILRTAHMSMNAIENILLAQKEETINWREWASNCKRKRSYSCGDEEREDSPKKKIYTPPSRGDTDRSLDAASGNKRKRDPEEELENFEATERQTKRPRIENSDGRGHGSENIKSIIKDDMCVMYSATDLQFSVLKKYFYTMPSTLWNEYSKTLMDEAVRRLRYRDERNIYFRGILDYTFCGKLTRCSTSNIEVCVTHLENTLYRKLRCCGKLESLNMTLIPIDTEGVATATLTLQRLQNLVTLALLPPFRYSFHWAIQVIGQHIRKLRELKIVYNGDLFNEGEGITDLQDCRQITSLWLFNFGRRCETKSVSCLLSVLPELKVLFHKELPNAILEMSKNSQNVIHQTDERFPEDSSLGGTRVQNLALERVDLCWYERGTGYQLVYVPSSYLVCVAQMCPNIKLLNLIGPPCLCEIVQNLPNLRVLILQEASLDSCLSKTLQSVDVSSLTVLRVTNVWDVTHDLVSTLAHKCPSLQILSITSSRLEARGALITPPRRAPFPCLREVTLFPSALSDYPTLASPSVWQLGAALTRYVLKDGLQFTSIHLCYKDDDVPHEDLPTELDLEEVLCRSRPNLRSLTLEWPPAASPTLVEKLVEACPALTALAAITTWPLSPRQCADVIASYGHRIDIT